MQTYEFKQLLKQALIEHIERIDVPGIEDAELGRMFVSDRQITEIIAALQQDANAKATIAAEVHLYLRFSSEHDVLHLLHHLERHDFNVEILPSDPPVVRAGTTNDWAKSWERGMEPLREPALKS